MIIPGFPDLPLPTEEKQQRWAGPMFHPDRDVSDTANKQDIEINTYTNDREASTVSKQVEENSEASDVIFDEEEVEVHLPDTPIEEEGISFKNENPVVDDEEEVEAHLPDDVNVGDGGVSFENENHDNVERWADKNCSLF